MKTFFSGKTYSNDILLSTYLVQMLKILFLVKNCQKDRHGCVKSEHTLFDKFWVQNFPCVGGGTKLSMDGALMGADYPLIKPQGFI